jgi:glutathione S-transferase
MSNPIPVLTYFSFRGLGEAIRLLFEDQGLPYEDRRVSFDEWAALKPRMRFGQMPRLEIGEETLFQSQAILRYLGRAHGLCGDTEAERIRCDVAQELARDGAQRLVDHFWSPGSDTPEAAEAFKAGALAQALRHLADWLGDGPYFGGSAPLFSDYYALTVIDEAALFFPRAVEREPALTAYRRRMYERPGLAAYAASGRQPDGIGFDPARGVRSAKAQPSA